jgi:glycerophosphoryl diester phosphodiesterase
LIVLISISISGFFCFVYYKIKKVDLPEGFTITAHTGCEETEENSLESIRTGYESGADIVEFDLAFKSDGEAVLSHDEEPMDGCVTLDDAFALIAELPDIRVNVDCKSVANLNAVAQLAEEHGIIDRIFFTGISEEDVSAVKEHTSDISYWLNFDVDTEKNTDEKYLLFLAEKTRDLGAVGLNINHGTCTKELVEVFHREGLLVSIWTVNEIEDMIKDIGLGADNITSRHPTQLVKIIELNNR